MKTCWYCGIEITGPGYKKSCKPTHEPSYRKAKMVKRRVPRQWYLKPKWESIDNLYDFYVNKPDGFEVDHVIPLNHELVSGLHIVNNLQYLSPSYNAMKKDAFDGTAENTGWLRGIRSLNLKK